MVTLKPAAAFSVLFPIVGAALWTVYGQTFSSGAASVLLKPDECPYPPKYFSDSQLKYTGVPYIDQAACIGVEFMKVALFRRNQPFTVYFTAAMASSFLVLNIEGLRRDGPSLWFPFATSILSIHLFGEGIIMPLAWIFIFFSSYRDARRPMVAPDAEALFLSHIFGYLFPTALMIITAHELTILLWSMCPLLTLLIQRTWLSIRPPTTASGFWTTQLALGTTMLTSTAVHLTMMVTFSRQFSPQAIMDWLPAWTIADAKALTTEAIVLQVLQWDFLWMNLAAIVAGFLYADSWPEYLLYVMAAPMLLLGFGPGAVISGMWMWREWKLSILEEAEIEALKAADKKEE
ncbi:hypothetical protein M408DRAFT_20511 [Serendipita vermifera MAFF 305830]|uniref:Uncharacterized protein n=1 Tax=Serendipita vermifera MAFF 305830 TaxID=933852 RepID=A0A0C3B5S8_SERVB|nr:hypothetical protein M408DRAFT_20511 [Serendipita vermifera MAFF 305830]